MADVNEPVVQVETVAGAPAPTGRADTLTDRPPSDLGLTLNDESRSRLPPSSTTRAARERRLQQMADMEDEVYQTAVGITHAVLDFAQVTPYDENPPEEWVQRFGLKPAEQRLRVAKMGHMTAKDCPVGVKIAQQVWVGIAKARGQKAVINNVIADANARIALPAPTTAEHPGEQVYEVREMDE